MKKGKLLFVGLAPAIGAIWGYAAIGSDPSWNEEVVLSDGRIVIIEQRRKGEEAFNADIPEKLS